MALITIWITSTNSQAQTIIPGGKPANFGIDADVKSDTFAFGTSMGSPVGTDDWFKKAGGTGIGVIDSTGSYKAKLKLQSGQDTLLDMPMNFSRFSLQNGNLLLDGRYSRDGAQVDYTYFAGNAQNAHNPTTWPGSTAPGSILDKCDIIDTYIHLRRDGPTLTGPNQNHLFMMLGATVMATNGSHYIDFELYKERLFYTQSTGKFSNSGPAFSGGHTMWEFAADGSVNEMGDMQISFTFNNTNVTATNIYIWVSLNTYNNVTPQRFDFVPNSFIAGSLSNYGYAEITALQPGSALPVWGHVNTTAVPAPEWGTTSKDLGSASNNYYSTMYAPGQFAEVGIDFTALGTDPAFNSYYNPCQPPYTRFIAKTRSSGSFSAALKDFTGPYPFIEDYTPPPAITPPGHLACNVSTVSLQPDSVKSPGIYEWTTLTGNITTLNKDTPYITVDKIGSYVLKTRTYKGCFSKADSVLITNDNNKPVAKGNGPYYVTTLNPIAQLQGGDATASNYSTPYGSSAGLSWKWTGPNNYLTYTQYSDAVDTGKYTLTLTELRNGCTATAEANVIFLSTLPIKLNSFAAASVNKNTVDVKWTTTNEDGNEKYILERSVNGITFSPVYNIVASKTSVLSNYVFRDDITGLTSTNFVYYRVKIYSHGALYSVSNVVKINSKADQIHNYISSVTQSGPRTNPVVNFYSTVTAPVLMKVLDTDGKVVIKSYVQTYVGFNSVELPANKINTSGIKFIQMDILRDKLNYKFFFK
jgi:hypothetical protein